MKRFFFTILLLGLNLVGIAQKIPSSVISILQSGNSITITFNLPAYSIKDTSQFEPYGISEIFKYIDIDYFGIIDDIGYPQLPQLTIDLSIPHGSSDFQVTSSNVETQNVTLNRKILPTQEDFEENPNFQINNSYYNSIGTLYDFTFQLSEPFIVFDEDGISFSIFPFTYNPQLNRITILTQATFTIDYSISELKSGKTAYSSQVRESYLSDFFDNYIVQKQYTDFAGRYLIITAPIYESTLSNFANYKRNIGFEVNVVNTNTTGVIASGIKSYIQTQYNNVSTRPDFVLLVGDHDDIPASGGNPSGEEKNDPITDLHYARLAGDDFFADVFIGRFSISNNIQLQNIIYKTTFMEMNLHKIEKKAKFLAGAHEGWNSGWMEKQFEKGHDYVIKNTFNPQGYDSQKLYQPSTSSAVSAINDNPIYYIYSGHGHFTYIAGGSFSIYNSNITSATNNLYPFVFSFACKTGNFAYSLTSIGEYWIRAQRGGVVYFGSSVNTMVNSDKAIEKKIFGDAFIDKEHIAAITNLGMKRYWHRFWSWTNRTRTKRYMKAYNLLGDPSLNKNGVKVLTVPLVCGPTNIWLKNPTHIPVIWSVTGDYSLSNQTDTSVVVTPTGINEGIITAEFEGLGSIKETIIVYNPTISGPTTVCTSNAVFTLNNPPEGYTITWSHTSGLLTYISGQGTDSYTVQAASSFLNGSGWVKATITNSCGSIELNKTVWVGKPNTPFAISGFPYNGYVFGSDTEYEFRALTSPGMGLNYYNWVIGCGSIVHGHGTDDIIVRTCTAPDYVTMNFDVSIRVGNECGLSDWLWRTGYVVGESGATYMVYPNPASSEITVALNEKYAEANPEKKDELSISQVSIMDQMGKSLMIKNFYAQELSVRINISALPKGYYIVKINDGESHTILKD